jgi:hypothetical protein
MDHGSSQSTSQAKLASATFTAPAPLPTTSMPWVLLSPSPSEPLSRSVLTETAAPRSTTIVMATRTITYEVSTKAEENEAPDVLFDGLSNPGLDFHINDEDEDVPDRHLAQLMALGFVDSGPDITVIEEDDGYMAIEIGWDGPGIAGTSSTQEPGSEAWTRMYEVYRSRGPTYAQRLAALDVHEEEVEEIEEEEEVGRDVEEQIVGLASSSRENRKGKKGGDVSGDVIVVGDEDEDEEPTQTRPVTGEPQPTKVYSMKAAPSRPEEIQQGMHTLPAGGPWFAAPTRSPSPAALGLEWSASNAASFTSEPDHDQSYRVVSQTNYTLTQPFDDLFPDYFTPLNDIFSSPPVEDHSDPENREQTSFGEVDLDAIYGPTEHTSLATDFTKAFKPGVLADATDDATSVFSLAAPSPSSVDLPPPPTHTSGSSGPSSESTAPATTPPAEHMQYDATIDPSVLEPPKPKTTWHHKGTSTISHTAPVIQRHSSMAMLDSAKRRFSKPTARKMAMDREESVDGGGSASISTARRGAGVSAGAGSVGPGLVPGRGRKRQRKEQEEGAEPIKRYCHQCRGANNYARMFCSTCPTNYCSKCLVNRYVCPCICVLCLRVFLFPLLFPLLLLSPHYSSQLC